MLRELVQRISERRELPIEVEDIRQAIIETGVVQRIKIIPWNMDPDELQGVFYQYEYIPAPYAQPELLTTICYSDQMELPWQRVVCCKEMIHIFDDEIGKTDTAEDVDGLLEKILGPLSTEDYGIVDFQATLDKLALYQCLALLFPAAARQDALTAIERGTETVNSVSKQANLPTSLTALILQDDWPRIVENLFDGKLG